MTIEREADTRVFGLAGSFPRPGWVVLDAARDHRFTGELVFEVIPEVRAYLDRGEIYLAERSNDSSLGVRLVEAGVLSEVQRDRGAMHVGDGEHLGRLFERVPSVDRDAVIVITEMMNDECVSWLAAQPVRSVEATPYRRHVSGVHRWRAATDVPSQLDHPWPAPSVTASPVTATPVPAPAASSNPVADIDLFGSTDDLVRWDEPSWLDDRRLQRPPPPAPPAPAAATGPAPDVIPSGPDWIDRLDTDGLPDRADDPLTRPASLPPVHAPARDRFEMIWPSGDVDEAFGSVVRAEPIEHPDRDRTGPTVRIGGLQPAQPPSVEPAVWEFERDAEPSRNGRVDSAADSFDHSASTDDVVLAVRRAVASIETGSLEARRRLATDSPGSAGTRIVPPGRSVVTEQARSAFVPRSPSVFDDDARVTPATAEPVAGPVPPADDATEPDRVSALRRLIGGLRRR